MVAARKPASASLSEPARERRSHAERTAATRRLVIGAVVECITDVGFQRTTAAEITRRAGVTWGAVQHHFGGKDGLLIAVLEDSFSRFAERLEDIPVESTSLEERVSLFVERAWEHFRSRHYRSTFEILLGYLGGHDIDADTSWREHMFTMWDEVWAKLFADASVKRPRRLLLEHYTVSVLSGLASTAMLQASETELPEAELRFLKDTLLRELSGA